MSFQLPSLARHTRLVLTAAAAPTGPARVVRRAAPAPRPRPEGAKAARAPLGQILLDRGHVDPGNMAKAVALRARQEARLGDILLARGWVCEADLIAALATQWAATPVDLAADPPDPALVARAGAETCLAFGIVPWRRLGGATVIATARPETFATATARLPRDLCPFVMAIAPERAIHQALTDQRHDALARRAETRVAAEESCRSARPGRAGQIALVLCAALALGLWLAPLALATALLSLAVLSMVATSALKVAALIAARFWPRAAAPAQLPRAGLAARLPTVTILVALYREENIASRLVERLQRLDYPKELLDVILVTEADDDITRATLSRTRLPQWMRVIPVPAGPIRTKPRALNYALPFAKGTIVGVYDAEDAPEPQQIHKVVRRFREVGPDVACLQGVLDFYASGKNWLSRCFAIEYAAWFRVVLPGLARLGLVVPLGGTTLFFRRAALEALGGWDAHNVTEDADLGLRLARYGYRTELIASVTEEEPNARLVPWVRQRSRWIKGYAMTYAVHMRRPRTLWRELGAWRFLGVQVLFLGTLLQVMLAPVLWTFWLLAFGLSQGGVVPMPQTVMLTLSVVFVAAEALNLGINIAALRLPRHRALARWVPTMLVYAPLASVAAMKALTELVHRPFHWDKTAHGIVAEPVAAEEMPGPDLPASVPPPPTTRRPDAPTAQIIELHPARSQALLLADPLRAPSATPASRPWRAPPPPPFPCPGNV